MNEDLPLPHPPSTEIVKGGFVSLWVRNAASASAYGPNPSSSRPVGWSEILDPPTDSVRMPVVPWDPGLELPGEEPINTPQLPSHLGIGPVAGAWYFSILLDGDVRGEHTTSTIQRRGMDRPPYSQVFPDSSCPPAPVQSILSRQLCSRRRGLPPETQGSPWLGAKMPHHSQPDNPETAPRNGLTTRTVP